LTKFLFFTDSHFDCVPASQFRVGDYPGALVAKLNYVVNLANKGYDFVVFGGDFFEKHRVVDFGLLSRLAMTLKRLKVKMYYVWGQHDLDQNSKASRKNSTFQFIARLLSDKIRPLKSRTLGDVHFESVHVWEEIPVGAKPPRGEVRVLVAHKLIVPHRQNYECFPVDTLNIPFQLCLSGDYHGAFRKRVGQTLFVNPGPLARRHKPENHAPSVLSVTVDGTTVRVKRKEVPHQKYSEVFVDKVEDVAAIEQDNSALDEFSKAVGELEVEAEDIFDLIETLVQTGKTEVKPRVLKYILSKRQ